MNRLLCILSSLNTGGAETFMMKIFRALPQQYKIDFIVSTDKGYYEEEVLELGGKIHRVPLRTKYPLKTFKEIIKIVKENHYTCILKLCDTPIGYFDLLAAKIGGANRICVRSCNANSFEGRLRRIVNIVLRPVFNHIIDIKLAPSKLAANYTFGEKEVNRGKVNFIHNAVDLNIYKYSNEGRTAIRKEYGITDKQLVVGHIGRFNYQKNHSFLLGVFGEILKINADAKLILVGEGEKKEDIIRQIKMQGLTDAVIFAGIRSDIPQLLSAMDIFIFPSLFEGMPNAVIEAQAIGLPCLVANTITREADITGIVKYKDLSASYSEWANSSMELIEKKHTDVHDALMKNKYDIDSTVTEFISIVFASNE